MVIFPHLLIGAAIGLRLPNFLAVFIFGLIAHFLADKIPHWDYEDQRIEELKGKDFTIFLLKVVIDLAIGSLLLFFLLRHQANWSYALAGAFFSALPDWPIFLRHFFSKTKWLASYQKFHDANHRFKEPGQKILLSLAIELAVAALAILFIKL